MLSMPVAYPLPYGEYLAETEALQLLTAHDLYNELRTTFASVQVLYVLYCKIKVVLFTKVQR